MDTSSATPRAHRTLVRGGSVVAPDEVRRADVLIEGESIVEVGPDLDAAADEIVDATGWLVLPGLVDSHTHLAAPGMGTVTSDDFDSGTRAALSGGTTTIVDFAFQDGTLAGGLETWSAKAAGLAHVDYGFHLVISDPRPDVLAELPALVAAGVTSFKVFMTAADSRNLTGDDLATILDGLADSGGLLQVHAEDGAAIAPRVEALRARGATTPAAHLEARPTSTEVSAVATVIDAVRRTQRPAFVVHVSSGPAATEIARARDEGLPVYAETCVHYLTLTEDDLRRPGFEGAKYVCSPPLRSAGDQATLWEALASGHLQICSSDHCPYNFCGQKDLGRDDFSKIPNGLPTIENRLNLLWEFGVTRGHLTPSDVVRIAAAEPARIFGLPRKGAVATGYDADLLLFDPEGATIVSAARQQMAVDYNPFEGVRCAGAVRRVISRGETVVRDGEVLSSPGRGRFLTRSVGPFPAGRIKP